MIAIASHIGFSYHALNMYVKECYPTVAGARQAASTFFPW
jgi:hypothetical protein